MSFTVPFFLVAFFVAVFAFGILLWWSFFQQQADDFRLRQWLNLLLSKCCGSEPLFQIIGVSSNSWRNVSIRCAILTRNWRFREWITSMLNTVGRVRGRQIEHSTGLGSKILVTGWAPKISQHHISTTAGNTMSNKIDSIITVGLLCHGSHEMDQCIHDVTFNHVTLGRCFTQINGYQLAQLIYDKRWPNPSEQQIEHFKRFRPHAL